MLEFAAKTDAGVRGGDNEDAIGWDEDRQIWLVADGMGGHVNGQIASQIAKSSILEADPAKSTDTQLVDAHEAILSAAKEDQELVGMGSTVVLAKMRDKDAEISWVGDSRAYLWRRRKLRQLTRDHSFLEVLRQQNVLTEEQIRADPRSNLVTQTLGHGDPQPEIVHTSLRNGDRILLCSDGLNDELDDARIAEILSRNSGVQGAVDELVATALASGGRDNTSVIVIEYAAAGLPAVYWRIAGQSWFPFAIGAVLALIFAFVIWVNR